MKDTDQPSKPTSRVQGASGGFADKMGNKYELSWTVYYALQCLQDERRSITYEELDPELADGSEFTFVDECESTMLCRLNGNIALMVSGPSLLFIATVFLKLQRSTL